MSKIAAVVVLYNSELNVLKNIKTYIDQVEKLYAVDNSEVLNSFLIEDIKSLDKTEYIANKTNIGIAAALNIGAKRAIDEGYNYLLTMDQDSQVSSLMVSHLLGGFTEDSKIALVSPTIKHVVGRDSSPTVEKAYEQVFTAWTSGSLLDLNIFKLSGGFKEELFIDYVDHEYCLHLNKMGYKIYRCNKTFLKHSLGKIEEVNLVFRKVYPTNHSAIRLYYRARNRFYVKKIYKKVVPAFFMEDDVEFWKAFLKAVLFEKDRIKKIRFFVMGYIDYKNNKFGKFV
jgi:rhamnosyltransferase